MGLEVGHCRYQVEFGQLAWHLPSCMPHPTGDPPILSRGWLPVFLPTYAISPVSASFLPPVFSPPLASVLSSLFFRLLFYTLTRNQK